MGDHHRAHSLLKKKTSITLLTSQVRFIKAAIFQQLIGLNRLAFIRRKIKVGVAKRASCEIGVFFTASYADGILEAFFSCFIDVEAGNAGIAKILVKLIFRAVVDEVLALVAP